MTIEQKFVEDILFFAFSHKFQCQTFLPSICFSQLK